LRITSASSITLITRISPWHFGHISGLTAYIFWINRAQFYIPPEDGLFLLLLNE